MDHTIEWGFLGLRPLVTDLNTPKWIEALFFTHIDTLRELYVSSRQLSWVTLPEGERRRVYADVLRRIRVNFRLWSDREEIPWAKVLDLLMQRDATLSALGDPLE